MKISKNISGNCFEKLVAFANGSLSLGEKLEVQKFMLENPESMTTVHELVKLKKLLGKDVDLKKYLEDQTSRIVQKIALGR